MAATRSRSPRRGTALALCTLALASCSGSTDPGMELFGRSGDQDVLFLAQSVAPDAIMQALYEGRVGVDAAGCVRLDNVDRHTVVWPFGFRLDGGVVEDDGGRRAGELGGSFRFGGGEVPYLHEGIALPPGVREAASLRCPGRFWIVGEVLRR